ncbi:MAG TPA: nickel-dependent hydrogenase large subunit [Rhodocyclaceae bacterium]|nr:nickel-dependent hydrogenase large subunit [Rhodocyclaceae bacterium]
MSRVVVGPFNRVEGDLEVSLDFTDGRVSAAYVNSPLFRGFEQILVGRDPTDALAIVPRICGICSVSQSAAAAAALADLAGVQAPPNGRRVANLILAAENIADHFTHFYLFFMPDFARDDYRGRPWFDAAAARFKAVTGSAAADALAARAAFLQIMGCLAGKWPHSMTLQAGGVARAPQTADLLRVFAALREFRTWLERHLFGDRLEHVAALDSVAALRRWQATGPAAASDFGQFLRIADDLDLAALGRATDRFLSHGAYPRDAGWLFPRGVLDLPAGVLQGFDPADVREDVTHAWLEPDAPRHPSEGDTQPVADKPGAYTWCKAPRWQGQVVECGALARQAVAGHPLIRELVAEAGGNVLSRVLARLLEIALVVPAMEAWLRELDTGPFRSPVNLPADGKACGLVEAARGALGHWLTVRNGHIVRYQIVAPTTWNFSPRDAAGTPGALEQALVGLGEGEGLRVQHVVRSFDPCMVCTVH